MFEDLDSLNLNYGSMMPLIHDFHEHFQGIPDHMTTDTQMEVENYKRGRGRPKKGSVFIEYDLQPDEVSDLNKLY